MKKFAATNSVIPDRIKKRMSSRRVSPLAMGVNPLLLLKESEERDQPREAKRSWENATQKALYDRAKIEKLKKILESSKHFQSFTVGRYHTLQITVALQVVATWN